MDLDQLRAEIEGVLTHDGEVTDRDVETILLAAREYAAAQVELHARPLPWPWPPRRPSKLVGGKREAS